MIVNDKALKSRFGESSHTKAFDFFGADIEITCSLDSKSNETKMINFRQEVLKLRHDETEISKPALIEISKKKRKKKIKKNMGFGEDSDDNFIDDSEAYETFIPNDWTTSYGGFYINKGPLKFVKPDKIDEKEEDAPPEKKKKTKNEDSPKKDAVLSQNTIGNDASLLDPDLKNMIDSITIESTSIKDLDEDPKLKDSLLKLAEKTVYLNQKDRLCAVRYMVNLLGITLINGRKFLRQQELFFLNKKIDEFLQILKSEINTNSTRFNEINELIKYLANKSQIFENIFKQMKKINSITDSRDSYEKILTDLVSNKIKCCFDQPINTEIIFKLLESRLIKYPKKSKSENKENPNQKTSPNNQKPDKPETTQTQQILSHSQPQSTTQNINNLNVNQNLPKNNEIKKVKSQTVINPSQTVISSSQTLQTADNLQTKKIILKEIPKTLETGVSGHQKNELKSLSQPTTKIQNPRTMNMPPKLGLSRVPSPGVYPVRVPQIQNMRPQRLNLVYPRLPNYTTSSNNDLNLSNRMQYSSDLQGFYQFSPKNYSMVPQAQFISQSEDGNEIVIYDSLTKKFIPISK